MKLKKYNFFVIFLVLFLFTAFHAFGVEEDDDIRRITKEEAQALIGKPGVTIIDVRYEKNWGKSDMKIAGAVREHPNEIGSWVGKYSKDHKLILYCDWPNEQTSASVAYGLIDKGFKNVYVLKGGWWEWLGAGLPVEPKWIPE